MPRAKSCLLLSDPSSSSSELVGQGIHLAREAALLFDRGGAAEAAEAARAAVAAAEAAVAAEAAGATVSVKRRRMHKSP